MADIQADQDRLLVLEKEMRHRQCRFVISPASASKRSCLAENRQRSTIDRQAA
jgi:hypothetical protein